MTKKTAEEGKESLKISNESDIALHINKSQDILPYYTKSQEVGEKISGQEYNAEISEDEFILLAKEFGTPLFIIDELTVRHKVQKLKKSYNNFNGPVRIAYSMKANFNPSILKTLVSEGILFDLTSVGELFFYIRSGGLCNDVIYTSITEEEEEYVEVLRNGVNRIVISSNNGLTNLMNAVRTTQKSPIVLIRIDPEVGVKAGIRASYRNGKFGVPMNTEESDSAMNLIRRISLSPELVIYGFHFHLGSQITDPSCFYHALEKLESLILQLKSDYPTLRISAIDIGGATPVNYGSRVPLPEEIGNIVVDKLNAIMKNTGEQSILIVESGRYITSECGFMISRVVNTKINDGHKTVFVDAGYHLLLDSALLRQEYPIQVVPKSLTPEGLKINLTGRLCDTFDVFQASPKSDLTGAEVGKYIIFSNVGAYSLVFNMPFHCQTKPPIVMRRINGEHQLIRKSETVEELFHEEGGALL